MENGDKREAEDAGERPSCNGINGTKGKGVDWGTPPVQELRPEAPVKEGETIRKGVLCDLCVRVVAQPLKWQLPNIPAVTLSQTGSGCRRAP